MALPGDGIELWNSICPNLKTAVSVSVSVCVSLAKVVSSDDSRQLLESVLPRSYRYWKA